MTLNQNDGLFSGILNSLSNNNLIDIIQSCLIQIVASSYINNSRSIALNVLKNDNSFWCSYGVKNL